MRTLAALFRYNDWANRRVFKVVADLDKQQVEADARGTIGTIEETLKHLVGVEEIYLAMSQGRDLSEPGQRETYFRHDLAWFRERAAELGAGYSELVAGIDERTLERELPVPWIAARLTVHDGLLQVLNHSAQHQAQIFSTLGERGETVPALDYVLMLSEG